MGGIVVFIFRLFLNEFLGEALVFNEWSNPIDECCPGFDECNIMIFESALSSKADPIRLVNAFPSAGGRSRATPTCFIGGDYIRATKPESGRCCLPAWGCLPLPLTMLHLQLPTDPRWAALATQDLRTLLIDHAWCEHKAASNALAIIVRNPGLTSLVRELLRIAQEEMAHFGMVVERIEARGWALEPEKKDNYVNELLAFVRKDGSTEERLVDRLLFSAMIEARSCERFKMLSETVEDAELRTFYRELMESEAGHCSTFIGLARQYGGRVDVDSRWKKFLAYEAEVVARYGTQPEMHG